ncbi:MAG: metal-dependent hydrolase [Desulfobulbaceae bacterium]|nr:metal-dependent hydrolase [Desulfobulbaceae bacterium]
MYPPGHLAVNLIFLSSVGWFGREKGFGVSSFPVWPVAVAALFPDVVDKVVCDYLHLASYGRNWTHNLVAVLLCSLVLGAVTRSRFVGYSWAIGHIGHLVGDFVFVPWLWPLFSYSWPNEDRQIAQGVVQTVLDLGHGNALSAKAMAIWTGNRLLVEAAFFVSVTAFYWQLLKKVVWSKSFFVLSMLLWLWVIVAWDLQPFLWTWARYGII